LVDKKGWTEHEQADGITVVNLNSWKFFHNYVTQEFINYPTWVWRGQKKAAWTLQSSFDRLIRETDPKKRNQLASQHLARFKMASRGRRGITPQKIVEDSEWWALAQHNGMSTPLLDWTESPFVALYFAFEKESEDGDEGMRAVWGLSDLTAKNEEIEEAGEGHLNPTLELVRPMQDENLRLVSQSGLFTQLPPGMNVEDWIKKNFAGDTDFMRLVKIEIPETGRHECLQILNRMNINHLSLFPDLYGAGKFCDKALQINKYGAIIS
jgi:hypothetical protein